MPHIIVEYPQKLRELSMSVILIELHDALCRHETIVKSAVKTRAIPFSHCVVGEEDQDNQCVHITLRLLPGRDKMLRKAMAQDLYSTARGEIHKDYPNCAITVEVVEMDEATYTK